LSPNPDRLRDDWEAMGALVIVRETALRRPSDEDQYDIGRRADSSILSAHAEFAYGYLK